MGTRSFIGSVNDAGEFKGRYVHWDGYPTAKGPQYTQLLTRFDGGISQLLKVLTEDHYGWSSIDCNDGQELEASYGDGRFVAVPGFGVAYTTKEGQSSADDWVEGTLGEEFESWGTEWGYLFHGTDPATAVLVVVDVTDVAKVAARIPVHVLPRLAEKAWEVIGAGEFSEEPLAVN